MSHTLDRLTFFRRRTETFANAHGVLNDDDRTVAAMSDFVCGANEVDFHYTGVNWGRDLPEGVAQGGILSRRMAQR